MGHSTRNSTSSTQSEISHLYDFIYIDQYRLKSLIAQINSEGYLLEFQRASQVANTTSNIKGTEGIIDVNAEAGLNFGLTGKASTKIGTKRNSSATDSETDSIGNNLKFDATFAAPMQLIEMLKNNNFLASKNIQAVSYGNLFLIDGQMSLVDTSCITPAWDLFTNTLEQSDEFSHFGMSVGTFLNVIKSLPTTINFTLQTHNASCWSTLNPDNLLINVWDFVLKNGSSIAGKWYCLGVLDSNPRHHNEAAINNSSETMETLSKNFVDQIRNFVGISHETYGITPILIYREAKPKNS